MDEHLLRLLEFEGVLMVLVTTNDGLVVGTAGLTGDDADIIAAGGTSIAMADGSDIGTASVSVDGGMLHVVRGEELSLILVSDEDVPFTAVEEPMRETFQQVIAEIG
jgi:predicted regulator of Ras-like GTPase activity (Roadblock/LC7/MglB family)